MRLIFALWRLGRVLAALYVLRAASSPPVMLALVAAGMYAFTGSHAVALGFGVGAILLIYMPVDER